MPRKPKQSDTMNRITVRALFGPKAQLSVLTHKLDIAVRALNVICETDGPGADLSPAGPCYHVAKKALLQIRHN